MPQCCLSISYSINLLTLFNGRLMDDYANLLVSEKSEGGNRLLLKKIRFYNSTIVHIKNAQAMMRTLEGKIYNVYPGSLCYIEKNVIANVELNTLEEGILYEIYNIDDRLLHRICEAMEPLFFKQNISNFSRERIFSCSLSEADRDVFNQLISGDIPLYRKVYIVTYLVSRFQSIESLLYSIFSSKNTTLTERIKEIIESDLSKPWRLADLSTILHMSEVTIRKKLKKENNNFHSLLLDIRMYNAAKMVSSTEKHINSIAYDTGYTSTSYFISNFKKYFGFTPRQFSLKIKNRK